MAEDAANAAKALATESLRTLVGLPRSLAVEYGDPAVTAALLNMQTVFNRESSSHIVDIRPGRGFSTLGIRASLREVVFKAGKDVWDRQSKHIVDRMQEEGAPESLKRSALAWLEEVWDTDSDKWKELDFSYPGKGGAAWTGMISVLPLPDGRKYVVTSFTSGEFTLAPDVYVDRESERSFLASSSRDVLHYVERRATAEDIREFMGIAHNLLGSVHEGGRGLTGTGPQVPAALSAD